MRNLIYAILALIICAISVYCLVSVTGCLSVDYTTAWLGIAAAIVAVSAMSQLVFAVVVYFESVTLKAQMEALRKNFSLQHEDNIIQIQRYKDAFHEAAKASITGLMEALSYSNKEERGFQIAMNNLKRSQINIELAHGTYQSLWSAMQNAYKLSKRLFLELEPELSEKSFMLSQNEKKRIREAYKKLKAEAIKSMQ